MLLGEADVIEMWLKAVRAHAMAEAMAGRPPAGWKLVHGRSSRSWRDPAGVETVIDMHGLDPALAFTAPELRSPAQLEAAYGRKAAKVFAGLVKQSPGRLTLVPADDPREQVAAGPASDFAHLM